MISKHSDCWILQDTQHLRNLQFRNICDCSGVCLGMDNTFLVWIILFCYKGSLVVHGSTYTDETYLRSNLSSGYDTFVRPSSPTYVSVFYNLRTLQDLDISQQKMTLAGWLTAFWTDGRLIWNSSMYGNIDTVEVNWAWRPEFLITNTAESLEYVGNDNLKTRVRVNNDGVVRWNQPLLSETSCDVDITNFPFDSQTCELEIVFWGYTVNEVSLNNIFTSARTDVYLNNAEWEIKGSVTSLETVGLCCPVTESSLFRLKFTFTRRRPFYVMNLIFPTVLLSLCMVLTFLLPTDSGERLGFSLTVLLAYTVQLSITAQLMPTTSLQVPHIAKYLLVILVLCSLIICNVVLNVKLFYQEGDVSRWLKVAYRKIYPIVFLDCRCARKKVSPSSEEVSNLNIVDVKKDDGEMHKHNIDSSESGSEDVEVTWAKVSILLDRIIFYVYAVTLAIVNGIFLNSISG